MKLTALCIPGVDVNMANKDGNTALHSTSTSYVNNNDTCIKLLFAHPGVDRM